MRTFAEADFRKPSGPARLQVEDRLGEQLHHPAGVLTAFLLIRVRESADGELAIQRDHAEGSEAVAGAAMGETDLLLEGIWQRVHAIHCSPAQGVAARHLWMSIQAKASTRLLQTEADAWRPLSLGAASSYECGGVQY